MNNPKKVIAVIAICVLMLARGIAYVVETPAAILLQFSENAIRGLNSWGDVKTSNNYPRGK